MKKKMVVISIDAMGASDLAGEINNLPTLAAFRKEATQVQKVRGIYPTLTYPSHTTIVTGEYPKKHGIINNTKIQSHRKSPDWYWFAKDVKAPTLYDVAKKEGFTTAAFLWPVTAKSSIDYNIAEIFPNRIWTNQVLRSLSASSPLFLIEMNQKYGHLRNGIKQPQLDDFVTACAVDTLKSKQPDLTLIHLVDMDSMRHRYGVRSDEAKQALLRQDRRVAEIIEATKEAGTYDETTFVILGDHYQIDVNNMIRLNALFAKNRWLKAKSDATVEKKWQVYAKSCDGSCYIYIDQASSVTPAEVKAQLKQVAGIEKIYTTEEAAAQGAAPNVTFMLEAKSGYYFIDEAIGAVVEAVPDDSLGTSERYKAVHGFSPDKPDYATTMMIKGPGIKQGQIIEAANLIDEAPTFAKILDLKTFPQAVAGKVLTELFES
ncbi:putative AlkP superfamily pyrophosphatase or phosphodiesterase [Enterococcus sp. PF1-24]|uniref:alkaline phosphatase family protein n=1 Tax=unclassified Enterococcus TaxID=2608891 RepID=UPI0024751660|nr:MULTISPECIES: ectonucleotide pyrophosphatase/phosphodiesterase [unclassified Enterococcus]MDH6364177.1 putative AlkP superfamily pyrophosphatase or phosphodiesterase [Enterococcus sp. PFB1-1]MDH6401278.1 putative AlkP superfamily pyrophosphatase or phosphodiesterase [Enterococcus sp. PF1-24]